MPSQAADTSNFDQRTVAYLKRVVESIPEEVPTDNRSCLASPMNTRCLLACTALSPRNGQAFWPPVTTRLYCSSSGQFRQFPKWREFVRNASDVRIAPAKAEE